jgi:hypothetical protein
MVHVQLDKEWTDASGTTHAAGDSVDVDAATLADLQEKGVVSDAANWAGPTAPPKDGTDAWAGPTSAPREGTDGWAGPTSTEP